MRTTRRALSRPLTGVGVAVAATALGLLGTPAATATTAAQPAEGVVQAAGAADAIPGSYIVVLKDGAGAASVQAVTSAAQGVVARHGGTVARTYSAALHGFSARMTDQQARRTAADPAVASVEQNRTVHATATQSNPPSYGLDRIDQRTLPLDRSYTYSSTASNVTAYILDTGINLTHSDFGGRARSGYDFVDNDSNATDCNGHGTHVSGTVGGSSYGVAKGVKLVAVRVLDCQGSGSYDGIIAGIDWVTQNAAKPAVANMSLGGGYSSAVNNAVTRSINSGVTYGVAGGNSSDNACNYSPASAAGTITAGATTSSDARASYSNYGQCLDIFAPGSNITSAWIGGNSASNTISGTSMATPHVVGAAALYLAKNPSASAATVRTALLNAATPNRVSGAGSGSPNKLLYTGGF